MSGRRPSSELVGLLPFLGGWAVWLLEVAGAGASVSLLRAYEGGPAGYRLAGVRPTREEALLFALDEIAQDRLAHDPSAYD